jgi:hypothetical protein
MATVFEEYTTEEHRSVVSVFLWAKELNAEDVRKETCIVYNGKCLTRKAIHSRVEKFSEGRSKVADDARPGA